MRWTVLPLTVLGALTSGAASGVSSQQVRGTIRDSTSRLPVPGAVVTTLDSLGRVGRRTISDARGAYFITATGAARLRVVRLGFRPLEVDLRPRRDATVGLDIVMLRIPYELQPVRVAAGASCPRRSDRRAALALLEQARAGLLTTVVARSDKVARMKRLSIERRLDARTGRVTRHRVTIDSVSSGVTAFGAARSATDFVTDGFTSPDSGAGITFYAPDADVLLDDGFAAGYCFHVMPRDRARPNQVGLGFRAANRRRDRVDVDGALWIDTVARALVDLQFRYVGLDRRIEGLEPGGRVAFREMANGVVLIDRWMLRLVGGDPDSTEDVGRVRVSARRPAPTVVRLAVAEVGGELARAVWPDGHAWNASLGTLRLRITTDRGSPVVETLVRLHDTDYQATTDSSGNLEITDIAPGPYSARIVDPRLEKIGITLATELAFSAARDSVVERGLVARTAEQYVAQRCEALRPAEVRPGTSVVDGTAWVIGLVVGPNGKPLGGVKWAVSVVASGQRGAVASGETGTDGIFAYCRATLRDDVIVRFTRREMAPGFVTRLLGEPLTVIHVQMSEEKRR